MPTTISVTFKVRRDTAANWTSVNPILQLAEPGLETDTGLVKYGDGASAWSALPYQAASVAWGAITGTLASQSDLVAAIDAAILAKGLHVPFAPATGDLIINSINGNADSPAAIPYAADRLDVALFHPARSFTASTLEIDVQTAGAGGTNAKIVIYADSGGAPGALIAASGDLSTASTGIKTWTPGGGQAFVANTKYWIGVHTSGGPSLETVNVRSCLSIGYDKAGRTHYAVHRRAPAYGSGAPDPFGSGTKTFANAPLIIMTAA